MSTRQRIKALYNQGAEFANTIFHFIPTSVIIQWQKEVALLVEEGLVKHYAELDEQLLELPSRESCRKIVSLLGILLRDDNYFELSPEPLAQNRQESRPLFNNNIFIVHGHDEEARKDADLFLRKQGFNPIILMEQPSGGKTIIKKLEEYTDDVGFGIVLYTPDDLMESTTIRARQNVVLEHGYLMGKLGRGRVCALVKGDVELPSDNSGIVYIAMGTGNDWKVELVRELKKAGYDASADKI